MKKSELRKIIVEEIRLLKEENELLKAQDECKATLFKVKKLIDPIFKKWEKLDFVEKIKTQIKPWNQLYIENKMSYSRGLDNLNAELIMNFLSNNTRIYIQPETFFQENIDAGKNPKIEGSLFSIKDYSSFAYVIKTKGDIKSASKKYIDDNIKIINIIKKY